MVLLEKCNCYMVASFTRVCVKKRCFLTSVLYAVLFSRELCRDDFGEMTHEKLD